MDKKLNVIDLFSGCGGFSLGFYNENKFNISVSIDCDLKLSETYIKNFPRIKHLSRDILSFTEEEIYLLNETYNFDIIIGGPPCQGFSLAGKIGRNQYNDSRNDLFLGYLKFVKIIKPKMFIMENVENLIRYNGGKTFKMIVDLFQQQGYNIYYKVINTQNYGIPQNRKRVFIVGSIYNRDFKFPKESFDFVTIKDAIDDLPKLHSGEKSHLPNHVAMKHTAQMLNKMSYVRDGGDRMDIPTHLRPKSGDARKYIRYDSSKPSVCITGDMRKIFHYQQNRALTNRELARIQTFPDNFIFYGNTISIQQQIGNAVPPKLANLFAKSILEYLNEC